jgi:hypothetical protein
MPVRTTPHLSIRVLVGLSRASINHEMFETAAIQHDEKQEKKQTVSA